MTTRIYIDGDIGGPQHQIEVYDADTFQQLDDVAEIRVSVGAKTTAEIRRMNCSTFETMTLCPVPGSVHGGKKLYELSLIEDVDPARCETKYRAQLGEWDVDNRGKIRHSVRADVQCDQVVSHMQLQGVHDPDDVKRDVAQMALERVTVALIQEVAARTIGTGGTITMPNNTGAPMHAGQPVYHSPFPPLKDAMRKVAREVAAGAIKQLLCDECKGTGFYHGLNSKEPCSKGCVPNE